MWHPLQSGEARGYVASPLEWPHSSFWRYVEAGVYEADWGQGQMDFEVLGLDEGSVGLRDEAANPTYGTTGQRLPAMIEAAKLIA